MSNISDNFTYFKANRDELIKDHINDVVVIMDCKVLGYYKTETEALQAMASVGYEIGTFNIQKCLPAADDKVMYYTRRVAF